MPVRETTDLDLTSSSFAHSSGREREDDSRRLLSRACKLSGSRLRLDADIKLSKPPVACALAKSTRREPRDRQRFRLCVEIRAANCFVPIHVNWPDLAVMGSREWLTYTVQARRETGVIRRVNLCRTPAPPGEALPATGPICPAWLVVSLAWLLAALMAVLGEELWETFIQKNGLDQTF
jgi:hypothetical protein